MKQEKHRGDEMQKSKSGLYDRIYKLVRKIPEGKVTNYGHIAFIVGRCTPRMVGYAMAASPFGSDIPWQRVVNSKGEISMRKGGDGAGHQRQLLEAEGVVFNDTGKIDLNMFGWAGPRGAGKR